MTNLDILLTVRRIIIKVDRIVRVGLQRIVQLIVSLRRKVWHERHSHG